MVNATCSEIEPAEAAPDYARYDRIWQRVAPTLNPYPETRAATAETAVQSVPAERPGTAQSQQLMLPGAQEDPCCMGSAAQEVTAVLEGFAEEEAADAASYRQLARCAPNRAAQTALRELSSAACMRSRELSAGYYLITGQTKQASTAAVVLPRQPYRVLLRDRYHAAACNGLNYTRAAEGTTDPCLQRLLNRFSEENYSAADTLLRLLAQIQTRGCNS